MCNKIKEKFLFISEKAPIFFTYLWKLIAEDSWRLSSLPLSHHHLRVLTNIFGPWKRKENWIIWDVFLIFISCYRRVIPLPLHDRIHSKDKVLSHDYWQLLSFSRNLYWKLQTVTNHETLVTFLPPKEKMLMARKSLASGVENKSDCRRRNRLQLVNSFFWCGRVSSSSFVHCCSCDWVLWGWVWTFCFNHSGRE